VQAVVNDDSSTLAEVVFERSDFDECSINCIDDDGLDCRTNVISPRQMSVWDHVGNEASGSVQGADTGSRHIAKDNEITSLSRDLDDPRPRSDREAPSIHHDCQPCSIAARS
jgi:hypothetical protein